MIFIKTTSPSKIKLFSLVILFFIHFSSALHLEGGYSYWPDRQSDGSWWGNYDHKFDPFGSFSFFPLSLKKEDKEIWRGLNIQTSFLRKRLYLTTYYGHVDLISKPIRSIYIGLRADVLKFESVGLSLKGTNYFGKAIIATIFIDPSYNFENEEMVWEFKLSLGLGKHLPLF